MILTLIIVLNECNKRLPKDEKNVKKVLNTAYATVLMEFVEIENMPTDKQREKLNFDYEHIFPKQMHKYSTFNYQKGSTWDKEAKELIYPSVTGFFDRKPNGILYPRIYHVEKSSIDTVSFEGIPKAMVDKLKKFKESETYQEDLKKKRSTNIYHINPLD